MNSTATDQLVLKTNLADAPQVKAMKDGRITSEIVKLDFCGPKQAHDGFKDMIRRNAYDAGELAIVTALQAKAYGKPFVLLPTPMSGRFQHHCAGFNIDFAHLDPKDIEGKKVGVRTYAQTTGLWIRGILRHEYGVDLDKVTWMTLDEGHLEEYADPPNCIRLPKGSNIPQMMLDGEVAAALLGIDMPNDPRVRTLVPEPMKAAKAWYAREHVVPINHMFAVHQDVTKNHPEAVREIFRMIVEARKLTEGGLPDPFPPIGLEANRKGIQMAIDWSLDQKIIPKRVTVDELFDDVTANLA